MNTDTLYRWNLSTYRMMNSRNRWLQPGWERARLKYAQRFMAN